ncbi:MAG: sterol desaturase family protein, partial [Myxococcota bacterium]
MVNPIAVAIPVFFVCIGIEAGIARWRGRDVYRFDDAIVDLSCGIVQQVTVVFLKLVAIGAYVAVYDRFRVATLPDGSVWTHVLAFLGVDLGYYAWHRFTHEVNVGWATHVVHHQSEEYNLAVALRQSVTSVLSSWPFQVPLALLGVSPLVLFTHAALNTLYQFWIHTELVGKLGPIEWVMNTPSHHRVHHAINPRYLDKNYAGVLIVWDRLFGTFEPETEPPVYGTVVPLGSFDPLWANVAYLWALVVDTARAPTWRDRVKVWTGRPAHPNGPDGAASRTAITRASQRKYQPVGLPGVRPYVIAQFVTVAVATTGVLLVEETAPAWALAAVAAMVGWTVWTWGALFEAHP